MSLAALTVATILVAMAVLHVVLLVSLARVAAWRAGFALVVPALAPYWCWQSGMRRRAAAWWLVVFVYALLRVLLAP